MDNQLSNGVPPSNDTAKKPTVIDVLAYKGGVGKSRTVIVLANCLGAAGYNVAVCDLDPATNTSSNYYLTEETSKFRDEKNMARVIDSDENSIDDYALPTEHKNVFIVPSSLKLWNFAILSERRFRKIFANTRGFDFVIVDSQPDCNQRITSAMCGADYIITPSLKDTDSIAVANFMYDQLKTDYPEKLDCWFIQLNRVNTRALEAQSGKQKDYIDFYEENFQGHITPKECWFPETSLINDIRDREMPLTKTQGIPETVFQPALYDAVVALANCFVDEDIIAPEVF